MPSKGKTAFLAGLFLICMCVLMLQIIETRVLSVIAYYYLAFFAIGMAMFGMTAGSLFVYFWESLFPRKRLLANLVWICAAFAVAVVVSALLTITTVLTADLTKTELVMAAVQWGKLVLILASPYVFAGMAIALALTRSPWPVPLVYGVDLVGAATGCLVVLAVLTLIDSVSAWFLVGALGALAGVFFSQARRAMNQAEAPQLAIVRAPFLPSILAASFTVLALANTAIQPYGLKLSMVKGGIETSITDSFILWNSFSRVYVGRSNKDTPTMWGPSPTMPATEIEERYLSIDGSAGTPMYRFDGDLSKLDFLRYDITNLAYSIRHDGRVAVIGVGGGRDLLSAAYFGFRDVTGVELNPIFVDLLTDRLRDYNRVASLPGVRLNADEGRSWFERSDQHFDLIQMDLVDTWAATGAGAFSLSENGLYTVEAWRIFFKHLTPTGLFTVSRWYSPSNVDQTGRMVSVAVAALLSEGITDPQAHLYLAAADNLATLIVSRVPFGAAELATLTATVDRLRFTAVMRPEARPASPVLAAILDARTPETRASLSTAYDLDLSPAYDDRPFFFQQLRMSNPNSLLNAIKSRDDRVRRGNLKAVSTLGLIILLSVGLVFITILVPSLPSIRHTEPRIAALGSAYFLLIGLGFMFVEMGLIQRISVYLGHPIYGLAIGLFGIILSTGFGSLLSSRISLLPARRMLAWVALLGTYIAILPCWLPALIDVFASAPLPIRAMVSLLAIVPSGVLMGFGFPTGMQIVNRIDPRPTPWFWAINGAAGVLASGLAVAISINFSISTTLWCGAVSYFLLGPIAAFLSKVSVVAQQLKPRFA